MLAVAIAAIGSPVFGASKTPFAFTVPSVDDAVDLHGDSRNPQLVLFVGGNQYMVLPKLLSAFEAEHPTLHRVFYETLPPNALAQQIDSGSLTIGNLLISVRPDVYESGVQRMRIERRE